MSTGQQLLVIFIVAGVLLSIALGLGVAEKGQAGAALNVGPGLALAAIAGAVRVLTVKAQTLQHVTSIQNGAVLTQGQGLRAADLSRFGDQLLRDDVYAYAVIVILAFMLVYEIRWGRNARKTAFTFRALPKILMLGFIPTLFLGASAVTLVYLRS